MIEIVISKLTINHYEVQLSDTCTGAIHASMHSKILHNLVRYVIEEIF